MRVRVYQQMNLVATRARVFVALASSLVSLTAARPAVAQGPAGTVEYYHVDAVGSVRAITNSQGALARQRDYFPFGEEFQAPAGADSRRFTAKERDAESNLDYFGARYYASPLGRFISVDPIISEAESLSDPQRWNRYSYVLNRPLVMVDPDGREAGYIYLSNGQMVAPLKGMAPRTGKLFLATTIAGAAALVAEAIPALVAVGKACFFAPSCNEAVRHGVEGLAPGAGSASVNVAYQRALSGGAHAGALRNMSGRSASEIRKAVGSYEAVVKEHYGYLANPVKKVPNWHQLTPEQQQFLKNKWLKDIRRNQELADVMRGLLGAMNQ